MKRVARDASVDVLQRAPRGTHPLLHAQAISQ
jgi:hypothetical protein